MITREQTSDTLEQIAGRYPSDRLKITAAVIDAWHNELINVKPMQIDKAIAKLGREFEKFPPTAMAFRRLCFEHSSDTDGVIRRCGRAGCPLTLSQTHQHACRFHDKVDMDRDAEVLDRMRASKLDVAYLFWTENATPAELFDPAKLGVPDWVLAMRDQYPVLDDEQIGDYKKRIELAVNQLVLGDIPLKLRPPKQEQSCDVRSQYRESKSMQALDDYDQLQQV